ncbi:MAG: MBL fold metallo-hydrolase [Halioglobus sp.]|nr:MBL fold metallo-hydrolase [Halioglobus sp.]MDG2328007.1 MBL fold metallo-hydrolase [Halioglobus sp.]
MEQRLTEDLGFGITRIDAGYVKPGFACFYLLESAGQFAVIETGTVHSVDMLEQVLQARDISRDQIRYVIPTHVHLDHAGGAGLMIQRFPEAQLLVHQRGARHLVDPSKLVAASRQVYGDSLFEQLYGEIVPVPVQRVTEVADGESFQFGERILLFRDTPGHADHHFCIWDEISQGWFSGDVFGTSYRWFRTPGGDFSMPATTPSQFRPEALKASLAVLAERNPQRIYLTHFCELRYSTQLQASLLEQIDDYLTLARQHEANPEYLETAIVDYSLGRVQALNPGQDMSFMREHFFPDAQLNAKGLIVWLQKESA